MIRLWRDATCVKLRKNGRVVSVAVIIACAVSPDGRREIIGMGEEKFTRWLNEVVH
jgi:transposase-like protein